jgi:glycosyltransferase involved in cell wall biosynthesis
MAGREAGGPETYEHGLVRSLAEIDKKNEYHLFCLKNKAAQSFGIVQENVKYHVLRPNFRWISIPFSLPLAMMRSRVDILHATFVPPPFSPKQYLFTVHGFDMFAHPEFYPTVVRWRLNRLIRTGLRNAKVVLCVSHAVKDLLADKFKISQDRLRVVHNAVGEHFRPVAPEIVRRTLAQSYGIDGPYVLYVGKLQACKNVVRILETFHRFRHEVDPNIKLVLVGKKTWTSSDIAKTIERLKLERHVLEIGYARNEDLPVLYSGASMFVFPSLSEGFGMPVLEALACGVPVITSNVDALPEVTGDAALHVNPYSIDDIGSAMQRVFTDHQLRESLRARGFDRAKGFTWRGTAEQTLAAYTQLAHA